MGNRSERHIRIGKTDCAMIFKLNEEQVQVEMVKRERDSDAIPDHELLMLAILDKLGSEPQFRDIVIGDFIKKHKKD